MGNYIFIIMGAILILIGIAVFIYSIIGYKHGEFRIIARGVLKINKDNSKSIKIGGLILNILVSLAIIGIGIYLLYSFLFV